MKIHHLIPAIAISLSAFAAHAYNNEADGSYCREFTKTIYVGGRPQQGYGTSCMQPDGSWQIVQAPSLVRHQPEPEPYVVPVQYVQHVQYVQPRPYYHPPVYRPPVWPFMVSLNYSNWNNKYHYRHNDHHYRHRNHHGNHSGWRAADRGNSHGQHGNRRHESRDRGNHEARVASSGRESPNRGQRFNDFY